MDLANRDAAQRNIACKWLNYVFLPPFESLRIFEWRIASASGVP